MGTDIIDEEKVFVKRHFGGIENGVCFKVKIDATFTQQELAKVLSRILNQFIVEGEGKKKDDLSA